ncbi:hypothetical protein [Sphaerisporangium corydalis]|uniref:Htaa domain-containing protein n=1 Tax=Sphaerisporangium corydalis TaxID=1441875 RepID=A0ABV9EP24_9ACTN|nr:hypothetical protein [Sphaerisporangium corydalis]
MNGWGPKVRRLLTATLLGTCTSIVLLPATPSAAETGYHYYQYTCMNGAFIPRQQPRPIQVQIAIPKSVRVGERIAVDWTMSESPLVSSAHFPAGGRFSATATVDVAGLWQGKLDSTGTKEQAELNAGTTLELPTAISGSVSTTKEGRLFITPRLLTLTFTPPASTVRVNDTNDPNARHDADPHLHGPIAYVGDWFYAADRAKYNDYQGDLHATKTNGASAEVKFLGDGIQYIGERVETVGEVEIYVDGSADPIDKIDAKDASVPAEKPKAQEVLWSKKLNYGDHTVTFKNVAPPGTHMAVDAFDLTTSTLQSPPSMFSAVCSYTGTPATVAVDVLPAASNGGNGSDDDDDDDGYGHISDGDDSVRGVVVLSGGGLGHGAPTATATTTVKPTPKKTSKARSTPQVRVTPKGGAHTGEAPDRDTSAPLLIGYGTVLALGGVLGGLALRRRQAVHGGAGRGRAA